MTDTRGARLLTVLWQAFQKDPFIDEFGYIPSSAPEINRSPIILRGHKLGVESWAVKILYEYASNEFFRLKKCPSDPRLMISLTTAILLVNPDVSTAWNARKTLITSGKLDPTNDRKLSMIILTKHPKSPETFTHRRWVLNESKNSCLTVSTDGSTTYTTPDTSAELQLCQLAADKYANNYNAWAHRIWTMQNLSPGNDQLVRQELVDTESWVTRHVSDHSGFQYRQFLLKELPVSADLLKQEFELIERLMEQFPGHESMWYHRKFLFTHSCAGDSAEGDSRGGRIEGSNIPTERNPRVDELIKTELEFTQRLIDDKSQSPTEQSRLALRHLKWLQHFTASTECILN